MSRQYSNRPFIPPRRRISAQNYDYTSYPASQTNDTPSNNESWRLTDSLSRMHQQSSSAEPLSNSTQNNFFHFQYPSHSHTIEPSSVASNPEINNNQSARHLNDSRPPYHFSYLQSNEEQTRPLLPVNLVTSTATPTASAPQHRQYRLENASAAAFPRHLTWFEDVAEDANTAMQRSSRNNNHAKRPRSSTTSTPTSQSYHHHERKRSRHEGISDENGRINYRSQENVLQQQQPSQASSHHHFQPYLNHRHVQPQPQPMPLPRTSYNDNVPSLSRSFDQRLQHPTQRHRIEHSLDNHNVNIHYGSHHRTAQPTQSRNVYHSSDHRPLTVETLTATIPRHQPIPLPPPPPRSYLQPNHHPQRNGIAIEPVPQRAPLFHRTSMTAHLHQRPTTTSFLTDLLHRVIDAHAASYSDNHVHYHHHPPSASIDLIAYAWMSPGLDIFSLPAAFSIQFGDIFDLTIPDETPVVGLTDSELERLPTMIFTKSCTSIEVDDKCTVCLSEYIGGEKLKRLRCKHFFHSECIDPWLKTSTRCPICRGEQTS